MCIRDRPSIVSVSVTALNAVPPEYEQGSLALGATDTETWFKISIPAAKSGIAAGIVPVSYTHLDVYKRQGTIKLLNLEDELWTEGRPALPATPAWRDGPPSTARPRGSAA